MAQIYQGQLLNKRFFPDDVQAKMPPRCRATLHVEDEVLARTKSDNQRRLASIKKIMEDARAAESTMTAADWDEMANLRSETNVGFARALEL